MSTLTTIAQRQRHQRARDLLLGLFLGFLLLFAATTLHAASARIAAPAITPAQVAPASPAEPVDAEPACVDPADLPARVALGELPPILC